MSTIVLGRNVDLIIEHAIKLNNEVEKKADRLTPMQCRAKLRESNRLKREALRIDHIKATKLLYIDYCGNEPLEDILPTLAEHFKKVYKVDLH